MFVWISVCNTHTTLTRARRMLAYFKQIHFLTIISRCALFSFGIRIVAIVSKSHSARASARFHGRGHSNRNRAKWLQRPRARAHSALKSTISHSALYTTTTDVCVCVCVSVLCSVHLYTFADPAGHRHKTGFSNTHRDKHNLRNMPSMCFAFTFLCFVSFVCRLWTKVPPFVPAKVQTQVRNEEPINRCGSIHFSFTF